MKISITKTSRGYWQERVDFFKSEILRLKELGYGKNSLYLNNLETLFALAQKELNFYIQNNL